MTIQNDFTHQSVLLEASSGALLSIVKGDSSGVLIDGTFGRGGHSRYLLEKMPATSRLYAFDKDPEAIAVGEQLALDDQRFHIIHDSFANLEHQVDALGLRGSISGILLDLGVSSPQLDDADRGFSFMKDGPLDMRMDNSKGQSAADWLQSVSKSDLSFVLKHYGEEQFANLIAGKIVEQSAKQPFTTTKALADFIADVIPKGYQRKQKKHPATKSFQAIRIHINQELEDLKTLLNTSIDLLKPGGRLSIISFHSLEDRLVKVFFKEQSQRKQPEALRGLPLTEDQLNEMSDAPKLKLIGKAIKPTGVQIDDNVRARSAILRVAEKI